MKKIKNIVMSIVFLCILSVVMFRVISLLEHKGGREKYTDFYQEEQDFDVILMGTSHMYNSVLPQELWKEYGIVSYNWGYSNCTQAENYYLLPDILKYTDPKLVVIDMWGLIDYENQADGGNGKYRTDRIEQQHVQFDTIPLSKNKMVGIEDVFDNYSGRNDFLFNFIKYHNRWTDLSKDDFAIDYSEEKGAEFLVGLGQNVSYQPIDSSEKTDVKTVNFEYLKKTLEYCSNKDIQVLCVYLPFPAGEAHQRVANSIGETIESYKGCKYLNLLDEGILDFNTDIFTDGTHLNYIGACRTSTWLGRYLREYYDIPDHRSEVVFQHWDRDYLEYVNYKAERIVSANTVYDKLSLCYGTDFEVELVTKDATLLQEYKLLNQFLVALGDNVTIKQHKKVNIQNKGCNFILTIIDKNTGKTIIEQGYDEKLLVVE